jgi:uncharacterized protein (TIGR03435 family)
LRQVGDPQVASEITQAVFILLARKGKSLDERTILSGWLCRTAYFVARDAMKAERRRRERESIAAEMDSSSESTWVQLSPLLDEAVAQLSEKDRNAIVLRYYEQQSLAEVGRFLGLDANSAQKRVSRALEKLRALLAKRGIKTSTALIITLITANAVQAAPAGLATATASTAIGSMSASASTLTLVKGTIMAWTKTKIAMVAGLGLLMAAGTTTLTLQQVLHHRENSVWNYITRNDRQQLERAPATVAIRPSQYPASVAGWHTSNGKILGLRQPINVLLTVSYDISRCRISSTVPLPQGDYDFIANTPRGQKESLQEKLKAEFGIVGTRETRETNVLLLTIKERGPGLKPSSQPSSKSYSTQFGDGHIKCTNISLAEFASALEHYLNEIPVLDRTSLKNRFDFEVSWPDFGKNNPSNPDGLKQVLAQQLGLELTPARESVPMLIVKNAD